MFDRNRDFKKEVIIISLFSVDFCKRVRNVSARNSAGKSRLKQRPRGPRITILTERAPTKPAYSLQIVRRIEPWKITNHYIKISRRTRLRDIVIRLAIEIMTFFNGHSIGSKPPELIQKRGSLSFLIIGAGSRGTAYATAISENPTVNGYVSAIAEPVASKRRSFWQKYISGRKEQEPGHVFETWQEFLGYELDRRVRKRKGESVLEGVDGVFVCVLDEMHAEIITALAPLHLHIMSEKPLATTLHDCLKIYRSLRPPGGEPERAIFSIGHVLRYSPHNMLLRQLLLEDEVIGDVLSIEHTEPVGYWHFSHSYVR